MSEDNIIRKNSLLTAIVTGCATSSLSTLLTYPLDFIKTQQQLNKPKEVYKKFGLPGNYPSSLAQIFKGGSALVVGSIFKNSARLVLYNWLTRFMAIDINESAGMQKQKTTASRIVIAGAMSGIIETFWIIPFENIKITMIQNMTLSNEKARAKSSGIKYDISGLTEVYKHHRPPQNIFVKQYVSPYAYFTDDLIQQYKGSTVSRFSPSRGRSHKDLVRIAYNKEPLMTLFSTIKEIYEIKGLKGFMAGSFITAIRQMGVVTSGLSTYNATRQLINPSSEKNSWFGHNNTTLQQVGLQLVSSIAVVVFTQPLDVIKSHMQLKNGKLLYNDSLSIAFALCVKQGYKSLWLGYLPRGVKVLLSLSLTGFLYAYFEKLVDLTYSQVVFS